jgi:hypothetical protein
MRERRVRLWSNLEGLESRHPGESKTSNLRHPGKSRDPFWAFTTATWIPSFAGMTSEELVVRDSRG